MTPWVLYTGGYLKLKEIVEIKPIHAIRKRMKKLILSSIMLAFALAVQAGDTKTCQDKDAKAACCSKTKATEQTKAACCSGMKMTSKETPGKQALLSPKAAAELGK